MFSTVQSSLVLLERVFRTWWSFNVATVTKSSTSRAKDNHAKTRQDFKSIRYLSQAMIMLLMGSAVTRSSRAVLDVGQFPASIEWSSLNGAIVIMVAVACSSSII